MMKIASLLALGLLATASARAEFYLYTGLTSPSYPFVGAKGINNNGDVVGTAYDTGNRPIAFRYSAGTFFISPSPGPSHSTWGNAINNNGTIVGLCDRTGNVLGNVNHAFYANAGGSAVDFDSVFTRDSEATAIIDSGFVVGSVSSNAAPYTTQAFLGHTSGWIMPLGTTLGNSFSAVGLNDSLVVVGNGFFGGETYNALTGTVTFLGSALGNFANHAAAINHSGTVAGKVGTQGFLDTAGAITLFGANVSQIGGMNASGDVVGTLSNGHAFVYIHSNGHFLDLNACVSTSISATWTLVGASGINDHGSICGQASRLATPAEQPIYGTHVTQAFRLSPFVVIFHPFPTAVTAAKLP